MIDVGPEKRPKIEECLRNINQWKSKDNFNFKYILHDLLIYILNDFADKESILLSEISMNVNELDYMSTDKVQLCTRNQVTGVSHTIHDQKDSNLCHTFALITVFKEILFKFIENYSRGCLTYEEIKKTIESFPNSENFSHQTMRNLFVMNISPRNLNCFIRNPDGSSNENQKDFLHLAIQKLCFETQIETHGWKRIIVATNILEYFRNKKILNISSIHDITLKYEALRIYHKQTRTRHTFKSPAEPNLEVTPVSISPFLYDRIRIKNDF